jgi:hypothetical protein
MSAYLIDQGVVEGLVKTALGYGDTAGFAYPFAGQTQYVSAANANRLVTLMLCENYQSVSYRYRGEPLEDLPGPYDTKFIAQALAGTYQMVDLLSRELDPIDVISGVDCYDYQSCEHDAWDTSEANAFCQALRAEALRRLLANEPLPAHISKEKLEELIHDLPGYRWGSQWSIYNLKLGEE